jgi:DnaJ-class molecular chaperone
MADDEQSVAAGGQTAAGDQICTPCRGTGRLISGLGGQPHQVTCPWCRGTGVRIPGIDAQESPAEGGGAPVD